MPIARRSPRGTEGKRSGWLARLVGTIAPHRASARLAIASALAVTGFLVGTPLVARRIVDRAIGGRTAGLGWWIVLLVLLGIARGVVVFGRRWYGGRVSIEVEADLRKAVHDHLQTLDPATHDALSTGQVVSRANADVSTISQLLAFFPLLSSNIVLLLVSLVAMALLSVPLMLVVLCMVPPLMFSGNQLRTWSFPASLDAQAKVGALAGAAEEAISGVRVVKGFGQERRELARMEDLSRQVFASRVRTVRIGAKWTPVLQTIPTVGQALLLLVGGRLVLSGSVSIGTLLAFFTYLSQLIAPIRMASLALSLGQTARAGAERVYELLDFRPRIEDAPDAFELPDGPGRVTWDDVTFSYVASDPVLAGFSLAVEAGETVALVGSSGSGKTTAALLIPRFHDVVGGSIRVDGVDVGRVTLQSLRSRIGVVFEDAFLFSSSVRDNIAFGRPDATDDEVRRAAAMAEADGFIEQLRDGYDTVVGEHGLTLSGGQRQRIALARALLTDPTILILDDATSALDSVTEAEIHDTLRRVMRGRTTVLIAHRRSSLTLADRIVVVDNGRVLDQGTHDELIGRCQPYRLLLGGPELSGSELSGPVVSGSAVSGSALSGQVMSGRPADDSTQHAPPTTDRSSSRAAVRNAPVVMTAGSQGIGGGSGPPGGFGGGFGFNPSPQSLARIGQLRPTTDLPGVNPDAAIEAAMGTDEALAVRRLVSPHARLVVTALVLVVLDALCLLIVPKLMQSGIDRGIRAGSPSLLYRTTIAVAVVALIDLIVIRAYTIVSGLAGERLLYRLRLRVFAHLQRLGLDFYESELSGRLLTRVTGDVDSLANLLQQGVLVLVLSLLMLIGISVTLLVMNWRLALIALSVIPPLLIVTWWFRTVSSRAYVAVRERVASVNANLAESMAGVKVVQAFTREQANTTSFHAVVDSHRRARLDGQRAASIYFPITEGLGVIAQALVLAYGAHAVADGTLQPGALVAFLLYLGQLFLPIQQLTTVLDSWQQANASLGQLGRLLQERPSLAIPADPGPVPNRGKAEIVFDDVRFGYLNSGLANGSSGARIEALRGVCFTIAPGETVAVVGATGAGKSTVLRLLARFHDPTGGAVTVGGVDLRSLDPTEWRRVLGIVPQEPVLFSGTIADNIAYGRPDASREEIEAAARVVGADRLIESFSDGYETAVSARGRSLSSGQRQLLALARAYLVDPAVLLLDEATANLDLATEARVQAAMGVLSRDRTTVIVAHRLDTARRADRILVLADGLLVESGTHAQLLTRSGAYSDMWAAAGEAEAASPQQS